MLAMRLMERARMLTESIIKVSCRQLRTARVLNKRRMRFHLRLESASLTRSRSCLGQELISMQVQSDSYPEDNTHHQREIRKKEEV